MGRRKKNNNSTEIEKKYAKKEVLKYPLVVIVESNRCSNCHVRSTSVKPYMYIEGKSITKPAYLTENFCTVRCAKESWSFMDEIFIEDKKRVLTKNAKIVEYKKWQPSVAMLKSWEKIKEKNDKSNS